VYKNQFALEAERREWASCLKTANPISWGGHRLKVWGRRDGEVAQIVRQSSVNPHRAVHEKMRLVQVEEGKNLEQTFL
jgi:hypothetical protein